MLKGRVVETWSNAGAVQSMVRAFYVAIEHEDTAINAVLAAYSEYEGFAVDAEEGLAATALAFLDMDEGDIRDRVTEGQFNSIDRDPENESSLSRGLSVSSGCADDALGPDLARLKFGESYGRCVDRRCGLQVNLLEFRIFMKDSFDGFNRILDTDLKHPDEGSARPIVSHHGSTFPHRELLQLHRDQRG